jgi:hypothetical protein
MDPDSDPAFFVIDLQDANKKQFLSDTWIQIRIREREAQKRVDPDPEHWY